MGSQKSKSQIRNLTLVLFAIVLARLIFGISPVEEFAQRAISPISKAFESISYSNNEDNQDQVVSAQIEDLNNQISDLNEVIDTKDDLLVSKVLKKDATGIRKTIVIDKGSSDGIKAGDPVLYKGNMIGQVERADNTTSLILLINDPNFKATAITNNQNGGVVRTNRGALVFDLATNESLSGEFISTDGIDSEFPPGIAIGVLGERITSEDDTFHSYHVLLPDNIETIDLVMVMRVGTN